MAYYLPNAMKLPACSTPEDWQQRHVTQRCFFRVNLVLRVCGT